MQTSTLVILGVIVLLAIVALVLIAARSSRMRHPALKPLSPEAQDRYVSQWDRIEAKFIDSPDEAVKEADALLLAEEKLPRRMRKARGVAIGREGRGGTEGMRQALLHYRAVVEEYGRPTGHVHDREHMHDEETRREVAG